MVFLAVATTFQWRYYPTWLVSTRTGLQTILQAIPATVIALFVLAFTTLFVVVQQAVLVFSSRTPLLLASDSRVKRLVARTALIAIVATVLGSTIPDDDNPPTWLTAGGATVVIATVLLVVNYGRFVTSIIVEYSAPRTFILLVVEPIRRLLVSRRPDLLQIRLRISVVGQSLRYALRRDDSEGTSAALEGARLIYGAYASAQEGRSHLRQISFPDSGPIVGWVGIELSRIFVDATEEALRLSAPQNELDGLVDNLGAVTKLSIEAHQDIDTHPLVEGLLFLSMSPYQSAEGVTNYLVRTGPALASSEAIAENEGCESIAVEALAALSAAMVFFRLRSGQDHPALRECVDKLGPNPRWDEAINLVSEASWKSRWVNQLTPFAFGLLPIFLRTVKIGRNGDTGDLANLRREVYDGWLDKVERFATWAYDTPQDLNEWTTAFDFQMAAIDLVGPDSVRQSVRVFAQELSNGSNAISIARYAAVQNSLDRNAERDVVNSAYLEAMSDELAAARACMNYELTQAADGNVARARP